MEMGKAGIIIACRKQSGNVEGALEVEEMRI